MSRRRAAQIVIALCAITGCLVASTSASAATPAPAWTPYAASQPTNFSPGSEAGETVPNSAFPQYFINLVNVGGAETSGPVEVVDVLPPGITASTRTHPAWRVNSSSVVGEVFEEECSVAGQTVTCLVSAPVVPSYGINIRIPVDVDPSIPPSTVESSYSVSGGGAAPVAGTISTNVSTEVAKFGFLPGPSGISGGAVTEAGTAASVAGSHPYSLLLGIGVPSKRKLAKEELLAAGALRNLSFSLPPGVVADPNATPIRCTESQLVAELCPAASQVGAALTSLLGLNGGSMFSNALYDMVPPPGVPAEFGFNLFGTIVHAMGGVDGEFHLVTENTEILGKVPVGAVVAELWGNPSDPRHDRVRRGAGCKTIEGCSVEPFRTAFLTMPSACSSSLSFSATIASWEDPTPLTKQAIFGGPAGEQVPIEGCESLQFAPTMSVQATSSAAASPTGLSVQIHLPQNEGLTGRATATLKKVRIQLPEGMTVNSSAANGLGACSPTQAGIGDNKPANCPEASKVGTVEIETPLLSSKLKGSVYLAEQGNNPFSTLLALYLVVEGEGVVIKLPGRVDPDPSTGRLTATFDNNPQLPFNNLQVNFSGGPRATLTTPSGCGVYNVRSELTSWASPTPVVVNSPISVDDACSTGGFNPGLNAGTTNPVAGTYSSFVLRVTRNDGEQNLSAITTTLPQGLLAKLAGVPLCSEANAGSGACPASSQIGTTTTGVGSGTQPVYIPQAGKSPTAVYLAGPYRGAPYSLVIKVPAQAGPFDLGTIAVRVALNVDLFTAQVTAVSDQLPQILDGIPVAYRDVRVNIDRDGFILNPTSCDRRTIESRLVSNLGTVATPSARFQVGGCESLGFKPELKLQLKGATKRAGHPALKAVVTYPKNGAYANIARAQVGLPPSEFLDQGNLNKVCTRPQLQADACPSTSIYGHAKAWTPLLERPLEGPVYLGVGFGYRLPALVADLNGQVRLLLKGKVDTTKQHGLRNTFEAVPDAPVSRFVLEMKGGKKYGLLENSENICKKKQQANATFLAQNGKSLQLTPKVGNSCGSGKASGGAKKKTGGGSK